ncbi:MAG: hypothetical protein DMF85_01770 [Acidobacteria bacterium]|nr:MAG: hypothetical protein DMF85_01770 [Acidobacteriota bacterium]
MGAAAFPLAGDARRRDRGGPALHAAAQRRRCPLRRRLDRAGRDADDARGHRRAAVPVGRSIDERDSASRRRANDVRVRCARAAAAAPNDRRRPRRDVRTVFGRRSSTLDRSSLPAPSDVHARLAERHGVAPASAHLQQVAARLARKLHISGAVTLLESALVEVPTVVGWLKPVVLLPASALAGLAPQQLEAILAHEFAHIRRHDYLVNLLQMFVETLLFYHPAVWWLSRRIRHDMPARSPIWKTWLPPSGGSTA